ncbi:DUF4245 family protein [Brachybacterium alimentarium]|uniref:DUF4245 family protein n=1 Tax=Brachybacterium alimentarium TaxID=47845 RepID=UPI000BB68290|nr:DUF4245 family protein [Brachybacterium alimentarium]PCC31667.1 hypothetical protein CIK71_13745 [Brachybacterium alimentarium]
MHAPDDRAPDAPAGDRSPDAPAGVPSPDAPAGRAADAPGADPAPATSADGAADGPALAPQQPKSAYELPSRKNTVLRNMVWALALTIAVVVVIGIAFFGVGSTDERQTLENSEVDVAGSAERAQAVADFPVAVPTMEDGWAERSARFTDGDSPRWKAEYTSPDSSLVTLIEESDVSAPMLSAALPGTLVEEELTLQGVPCQALRSGEDGSEKTGISCEGEDFGLLVYGAVSSEEIRSLTEAALADIQA